jgi:hypothetical protein
MTWSDLSLNPPARTLRQFAACWLLFFTALAFLRGEPRYALLALAVGPLGLWRPRAVRPLFVAALVLTFPLGWLLALLALGVIYYGVLTPLGLVLRWTGRDALGLRLDPRRASYWEPRTSADVGRYYRQF